MKSVVLAVAIAASIGGFALSSYAEKLPPYPGAAADPYLRPDAPGRVDLHPASKKSTARHRGEAGAAVKKPKTGDAVAPGGKSIEVGKAQ